MTTLTLASIEGGLQQPFAPHDVKYLPKSPKKKESGEWVCLALPYADKRAYEDRLNDLAFGFWSTPYNPPYAIGNKLVIPVTVTVCDIEHTDYGESFLSSLSRKGELHDSENSATVAYSQGFRRACAQFRLGRYLYTLPKVWVPYDPTSRTIALTAEQTYQLTMRLYRKAGISLPDPQQDQPGQGHRPSRQLVLPERATSQVAPASMNATILESAPNSVAPTPSSPQTSGSTSLDPQEAVAPVPMTSEPVAPSGGVSLTEHKVHWLEQQLKHNGERIQRICEQYSVSTFAELSDAQFEHLANRIFAAQKRAEQKKSELAPSRHVATASISDAVQQS
ncbi:hypothetical protein [Dictyobacter kobayashii]|uniref:Uncharacterized protein n=1 Tax=Dictyobacter kobayashii TaxID=2014872 RepID=A0A402AVS8_9CHLR|nr:hypothetical protein [Dictyobacter kobayashii]GCE23250.1 hypothetical protein KDK_70500 [Dictyobacter kobayashii]